MVRAAPAARQGPLEDIRFDLASRSLDPQELDAAAEEFGRPAFVGGDMRLAVADDGAPRWRQMRKRKRIGRRPRSDEEARGLMLEHLRKPALQALGPVILPVGERLALIRSCDRGEN